MRQQWAEEPQEGEAARAVVSALLETHRAELLAFARRRLESAQSAEELVQQVALKAMGAAQSLKDPAAGRAWLYRITRNALADVYARRPQAKISLDLASAQGDELMARHGQVAQMALPEQICRCVLTQTGTLKAEYQHMLQQVVLEGRAVTEVAQEMGITANNAAVRLHRARAALKKKLVSHCGTESLLHCMDCVCDERRCCSDAEGASA